MQPPEGDLFYLQGEFREVDPPRRLAYTFRWEDPDPDDVETIVTLSLRGLDGSTELTVNQGSFATEPRRGVRLGGGRDALFAGLKAHAGRGRGQALRAAYGRP